jgi:hypothetical protein
MKRAVILPLSLFFLLFHPFIAHADNSWIIENFNSNLSVQNSGVVTVVETISVDFRSNPHQGIYRDIPYEYEMNGKQIYTNIDVVKVLQNNLPAKYAMSESNGYEEISIGDPKIPVIGRNVYSITYTLTGILQGFSENDALLWNVTGYNWPVEIQKAEAEVEMPAKGILSIVCNEGSIGSTSACQSNTESSQDALFMAIMPLAASEGLTITVNYEKGLVPILTAQQPLTYLQDLMQWPQVLESLLIILAGIGVTGYVWYKYTGDIWLLGKLLGNKKSKEKTKNRITKVEFTSPENLRPAEIGVLLSGTAQAVTIPATVIDLAVRGFLHITEIPKKWRFGHVDYLFTKSVPLEKKALLSYEQVLLDALFYKRIKVKLSSLSSPFYKDLEKVKNELYRDVIEKKLFPFDPEKNRKKYRFLAILLGAFGICMSYVGFTTHSIHAGEFGIGLIGDSILFFILYRYMPQRTPNGTELYQRSKGYVLFIERAERYKRRYSEKENAWEILPFAIIFGLTRQFTNKMEKIGVQMKGTGFHTEKTNAFIASVSNFSDSMTAAIVHPSTEDSKR